jgi:hypothetical protein
MGEWSKKIGEAGEEIVGEFFELIGWSDPQMNHSIPCVKGQKHGDPNKEKKTHGIDYLFSYESQLENRTLNHLVVSVKYTSAPYPASPNSKFKEHFLDLTKTLECFKRSEIKRSSGQQFSGVDTAKDIGVLFWLSNDVNGDQNVINKISGVRNLDDYPYEAIYIVDNHRISFIYDSVCYLKLKHPSCTIEYFYPNTGRNYNPAMRNASGKILPVEFINSSVQTFKITESSGNKIFVIAVIDDFHIDHMKRLLGLAQEITSDLAFKTLILFPNFDRLLHENQVREAKAGFSNKSFTESVSVASFRNDFRSAGNE